MKEIGQENEDEDMGAGSERSKITELDTKFDSLKTEIGNIKALIFYRYFFDTLRHRRLNLDIKASTIDKL